MSILIAFAEIAADCYNEADYVHGDLHGWTRVAGKDQLASASQRNFYACAYKLKNTDFIAIAYRGTANNRDIFLADAAGIGLSLNSLAMNVQPALDFAYQWSQRSNNIWLVGHSLGGAYVQIVAATMKMWGMNLMLPACYTVNQYSNHPFAKFGGSVCSPAMQILTYSFGSIDLVNYFNKALAADDDEAFAAVANYRAHNDPVSMLGAHVGAPMNVIRVDPALNKTHRMSTIVDAVGGRIYGPPDSKPGDFVPAKSIPA